MIFRPHRRCNKLRPSWHNNNNINNTNNSSSNREEEQEEEEEEEWKILRWLPT